MGHISVVMVCIAVAACSSTDASTSVDTTEPRPGAGPTRGTDDRAQDEAPPPAIGDPPLPTTGEPPAPAPLDDAGVAEDGSPDASAAPDTGAPLACNSLAQAGADVVLHEVIGAKDWTQYGGGTIADGTYVLTSATYFKEPTGPAIDRPYARETIRVASGALEVATHFAEGDDLRFAASFAVENSTQLRMTTTCTWSSEPGKRWPLLRDWAPLEHQATGFVATATTLTLWTPVGNHASVERTFVKVE